jgi:hypothetical protein
MTTETWDAELIRFTSLTFEDQSKWFARLMVWLTVLARDTYTVGGAGLEKPESMRRFNELMHRTSDQLLNHLARRTGRPFETFAKIVGEELSALGVDVKTLCAQLDSTPTNGY